VIIFCFHMFVVLTDAEIVDRSPMFAP